MPTDSQIIYLDHAATTPVDPRVVMAMAPYWNAQFGNPSSGYSLGEQAKQAIELARQTLAKYLPFAAEEMYFTGSGTESDNLAILGIARANRHLGHRIVISTIEHEAVLKSAIQLEKEGFEVVQIPVDGDGFIRLDELAQQLTDQTILVSVMMANNEIGTIQPLSEIRDLMNQHAPQALLHTDACQAAGSLELKQLLVDALTMNGSKLYGPKGVGVLAVRSGTRIEPLVFGGGQEHGLRSGTENVPAIVGLAKAFEIANQESAIRNQELVTLRDWFIAEVEQALPDAKLNGHRTQRLPNNINFTFPGVEAESLVVELDRHHICVATGSACTTQNVEPSHVILALGVDKNLAYGTLRLTLGKSTTRAQLQQTLDLLIPAVQQQQAMSPS